MPSILAGPRPDITPAQLVGVVVAGVPIIANLLRAFGVYEASPDAQQALQAALTWGGVMAGLLFASDAGLRAARNAADAHRDAAVLATPPDAGMIAAFEDVTAEDLAAIRPARAGADGPDSRTMPDEPDVAA